MSKISKRSNLDELHKFMKKFPDTQEMEIIMGDINGVIRGKRIRSNEFESIFNNGFSMPGSTVFLDILGQTIPDIKWSAEDGDPDTGAHIIAGSLTTIPWAKKPSAQALFSFVNDANEPFFAEPRAVLQKTLSKLEELVPTVVMAAELEFYLLDANSDRPTPKTSLIPGVGRPQPGPQCYHPDDLWDIEGFLNDLYAACEKQNIPAGTAISEYAPGQFEINLHHIDDPLVACDHAMLLKRAIKAIARQHDFVACFMAKPFAEESGSGLHMHMSFIDMEGNNYFSQNKKELAQPPYSDNLRYAIGGLKETMAAATAIFAPNANSYRRLRPEMFAPVEPNWGANHRNVSLRIPISDAKNLRFEHRVSGADANPYLVAAAILSGVHYGITHQCNPGKMIQEFEVISLNQTIPNRWNKAIDEFEDSKILPNYLGEEFCRTFIANRRFEESEFNNNISDIDYSWYLRSV